MKDGESSCVHFSPIARIYTDFPQKFGIPRQSAILEKLCSKIVFEKEYRSKDALRGIESFSHLWLLWHFSENERRDIALTVRPPKLGGNERVGVFATRSPYRPNPIGLSAVKLLRVDYEEKDAPVLYVSGADISSGTPIFDIKPYLSYADSFPDAKCAFSKDFSKGELNVHCPDSLLDMIPEEKRGVLLELLAQDIRPAYHCDPERIYGFFFSDFEIKFRVCENDLTVTDIYPAKS